MEQDAIHEEPFNQEMNAREAAKHVNSGRHESNKGDQQ
jgi:hypothetical protein